LPTPKERRQAQRGNPLAIPAWTTSATDAAAVASAKFESGRRPKGPNLDPGPAV